MLLPLLPLILTILLVILALAISLYFRVESVDAETAFEMVRDGAVLVDVRTPKEYEEWHPGEAVNINLFSKDFSRRIEELDRNAEYVVYCRTGHRSAIAVRKMRKMGLKAYNLKGGVRRMGVFVTRKRY